MKIGNFRIGMRTIKSSLAVMICIFIFHFFNRGEAMIAALAAVFSLRQDMPTTITFARSRILGNIIGGVAALLYLSIQNISSYPFLTEVLLVPLAVALVIILSDGINNHAGIISAIATLLLISLNSIGDKSFAFAFHRILDTFIGTLVAIGLNFFIPLPPDKDLH